jgi:hypothetical protein
MAKWITEERHFDVDDSPCWVDLNVEVRWEIEFLTPLPLAL